MGSLSNQLRPQHQALRPNEPRLHLYGDLPSPAAQSSHSIGSPSIIRHQKMAPPQDQRAASRPKYRRNSDMHSNGVMDPHSIKIVKKVPRKNWQLVKGHDMLDLIGRKSERKAA